MEGRLGLDRPVWHAQAWGVLPLCSFGEALENSSGTLQCWFKYSWLFSFFNRKIKYNVMTNNHCLNVLQILNLFLLSFLLYFFFCRTRFSPTIFGCGFTIFGCGFIFYVAICFSFSSRVFQVFFLFSRRP